MNEIEYIKSTIIIRGHTFTSLGELYETFERVKPFINNKTHILHTTSGDFEYILEEETEKLLSFIKMVNLYGRANILYGQHANFYSYINKDFWSKQSEDLIKYMIRRSVYYSASFRDFRNFYKTFDEDYYKQQVEIRINRYRII